MAKPAKFRVGSSGSGKHTETYGPGSEGHVGDGGIRIGAGVEGKRVTPNYDTMTQGKSGSGGMKNMKRYSEE